MKLRTLALACLLATAAVVLTAPAATAVDCGTLPLYDATVCYYNSAVGGAETVGTMVECDVIGGPACGVTGQYPGCARLPDAATNCGLT